MRQVFRSLAFQSEAGSRELHEKEGSLKKRERATRKYLNEERKL